MRLPLFLRSKNCGCKLRAMRRQAGLTLFEVMIALIVLSIGLTAMAVLHLSSLQFVHSAHYRSLASTIALDFEERLWLELADNSLVGCPNTGIAAGSPAAQLIAHWNREAVGQSWGWSTAPQLKIPNLSVTVGTAINGVSTTQIPVTLSWNEQRFSDDENTTEQFAYVIRILCRPTT